MYILPLVSGISATKCEITINDDNYVRITGRMWDQNLNRTVQCRWDDNGVILYYDDRSFDMPSFDICLNDPAKLPEGFLAELEQNLDFASMSRSLDATLDEWKKEEAKKGREKIKEKTKKKYVPPEAKLPDCLNPEIIQQTREPDAIAFFYHKHVHKCGLRSGRMGTFAIKVLTTPIGPQYIMLRYPLPEHKTKAANGLAEAQAFDYIPCSAPTRYSHLPQVVIVKEIVQEYCEHCLKEKAEKEMAPKEKMEDSNNV